VKRFIALLVVTAVGIIGLLAARDMMPSLTLFVPGIGPVLDFFRTRPGLITAIAVPVALALLFFGGAIFRLGSRLLLGMFAPFINEEKRINRTLTRQIEANEKKLDATEKALKQFTDAVAQYARHLSSHTSAVQGLSTTSDALNTGSAVQNRFVQDLIKNTEERLVSKEALLATLKSNTELTEGPTPETGETAPKKSLPSYRDLHPAPPREENPAPKADKKAFEKANLVEAMVLPYYRAFDELDSEKSAPKADELPPGPEKNTVDAKKAVEAIMFPLYRTLYQAKSGRTASAVEKQDEIAAPPSRHKPPKSFPPGCARRHYPPPS
jgi:hypothetical protein